MALRSKDCAGSTAKRLGPSGSNLVRLKFEFPEEQVLVSDFMLWHHPLNYFYLPSSERDDQRFNRELSKRGLDHHRSKPLPDPHWHGEIVKSWDRIFDLDWEDEYIASPLPEKSLQGVFWELEWERVLEVREFKAR